MIKRFSLSSIKNKFPRGRSALAGNVQYSLEIIAVAHAPTQFTSTSLISIYPWSSGFGSKYADPTVLPTGTANGVAFSSTGNDIAVATTTTPYISVYPWSAGFGTKYANPTVLPTGAANGVTFF